VIDQQFGGVRPVFAGLGVPDCIDHIPMLRVPLGGGQVELCHLLRLAAAQFERELPRKRWVAGPRAASSETTNAFASSVCRMRPDPAADEHRRAITRSRIDV
jgi:hypothetical protein